MRIACLQFAPQVGDVDNNLNRADAILSRVDPEALDLLVLPELAFSGYNFKSLGDISQFLEPSVSGISSLWARTTALKYDCTVIAGYPEKVDPTFKWPTNPEYYNAAIIVNGEGETVANYRKTHLYYTDETWALEGPAGFFGERLDGLGPTAIGICMDLNPYKFEAPWDKFEFAQHVLDCGARLVVISMAWITNDDPRQFSRMPQEPDMNTLLYWVSRLEPIIRAESTEEVIVVFANRTGMEGEVTYAGTSAVIGIESGEVRVYGILGRGDKELLVVDTDAAPYAKLVYRPGENDPEVEAGEPEENDHRADYENYRSQHPQGRKESEDPPSSGRQRFQGESDATQGKNMSAEYSRNTSFSQPRSDPAARHGLEGSDIHTPTAPSPTPHSLRPRLMVSTNHPNSQRYLNGPSPASYSANASSGPFKILGGEASFHGSNVNAELSPWAASESPFESSRVCWPSALFSPAEVPDSRWTFPDEEDEVIASEGSALANQENRYSIRSDVSVWNNQPGRPPSIANHMINRSTSPHETSLVRIRPDAPERISPMNNLADASRQECLPMHPYSLESRHRNRSRGHERSRSDVVGKNELGVVCQRRQDMAMFADVSQQQHFSFNGNRDRSKSTSGHQVSRSRSKSRSKSRSRRPIPMLQDHGYDRSKMTASIPIALSPDPANSADSRDSSNTSRQRRSNPTPQDPPILRPVSSGRIRQRSSSKGRIGDQPSSRNAFMQREIRSNTPAKLVDRGTSRGRRREDRPATDQQAATPGSRERRNSANNSRNRHPETVDLSQFALIEEYTAPNCPVHGSRSRSRTGQQSHQPGHNRPATTTPARPPAQPERVGRRSTQNTPRPASRKDAAEVATRSPRPQVSPKLDAKNSKTLKTSSSAATGSRIRDTGHKSSDVVKTMVPEPLNLKAPQGPKTPKAMVLVSDGKIDPLELMASLRCVERSLAKSINRPRSAIW
ncbi:hydrolase, carbon-nitrogen family protein [Metarhizium brunneum]